MDDLAREADPGQERPAVGTRQDDVVVRFDCGVPIRGLHPPREPRDRIQLLLDDDQAHPTALEVLGRAGVVRMVVSREPVPHFRNGDPLPIEGREQGPGRPGPARVHEQA